MSIVHSVPDSTCYLPIVPTCYCRLSDKSRHFSDDKGPCARRKSSQRPLPGRARQLEAQRKYAEEQGKAQEPGKSARKEPKKPAKPADDDEDVTTGVF